MTDQGATDVIVLLADHLTAVLDMGGLGKRTGHMPGCQQGIWAGKYVPPLYPNGSPCSKRCQDAKQALEIASAWRTKTSPTGRTDAALMNPATKEVPTTEERTERGSHRTAELSSGIKNGCPPCAPAGAGTNKNASGRG